VPLYDFIYVDRQKVVSLYSQLSGGVVETLESSKEQSHERDNKRNYDFKVFKHAAGGADHDRSSEKITVKPHHALILELEQELQRQGYLLDLTRDGQSSSLRDAAVRKQLRQTLCVKVRGRAVIEDYERMKKVATDFPAVASFINRCVESSLKGFAGYVSLKANVEVLERDAKQVKDKVARAEHELQLKQVRDQFNALTKTARVGDVEKWILDGFQTWVDAYLPGINNLRLYPDGCAPDEHLFGHMKRDGLEEEDSAVLHFTYGSMPTEQWTLLGIVTSVPEESRDQFNPLAEFERGELVDLESVERGFRALFRGFDGIEALVRTCRFPRVLLQPLLVYREVQPSIAKE
jgi:hypothetical protein